MALPAKLANVSAFLLCGDTHSMIVKWRETIIPLAVKLGVSVIVVTGDFETSDGGDLNFRRDLSNNLAKYGLVVVDVGGNHDRWNYLRYLMNGRYDRFIETHPGVFFAPRGLRWTWNGVRFLALGGAYSIDRTTQLGHCVYDPAETVTWRDVLRCIRGGRADFMVTHDCPIEVDLAWEHAGRRLWSRGNSPQTNRNRRLISTAMWFTGSRYVAHGHYHLAYDSVVKRFGRRVNVVGMGANAEIGSLALVRLNNGLITFDRLTPSSR